MMSCRSIHAAEYASVIDWLHELRDHVTRARHSVAQMPLQDGPAVVVDILDLFVGNVDVRDILLQKCVAEEVFNRGAVVEEVRSRDFSIRRRRRDLSNDAGEKDCGY